MNVPLFSAFVLFRVEPLTSLKYCMYTPAGNEELVYNTDSNKKRVKREELSIMEGPDMREILRAHFLPGYIR